MKHHSENELFQIKDIFDSKSLSKNVLLKGCKFQAKISNDSGGSVQGEQQKYTL